MKSRKRPAPKRSGRTGSESANLPTILYWPCGYSDRRNRPYIAFGVQSRNQDDTRCPEFVDAVRALESRLPKQARFVSHPYYGSPFLRLTSAKHHNVNITELGEIFRTFFNTHFPTHPRRMDDAL